MISFMAMDFFEKSPVLYLPLVALFLFMLVFASITIKTFWIRTSHIEKLARMPLETEKEGARHE